MEFPTALLGVALGAVLIPQLSAAQGRGDADELLRDARLGPAPDLACCRCRARCPAGLSRGAGGDAVPARRFDAIDAAKTGLRAARLRRRPGRPDRRQDPRPRLLRAPGHPHAGDDRDHRPGADPGDERRLRAALRPRRAGAVGEPGRDHQRGLALRRPAARRLVSAGAGLGPLRAQGRVRDAGDERACWRSPRSTSTGSAWPAAKASASPGSRAASSRAALVYFGVLFAAGLRPRDFSRRA